MLVSGASVASASQVYISAMLLLPNVGKYNVWHWAYLQWYNVHIVSKSVRWLKSEKVDIKGTPNPEVQLLSIWERKLAKCKRLNHHADCACLCVSVSHI